MKKLSKTELENDKQLRRKTKDRIGKSANLIITLIMVIGQLSLLTVFSQNTQAADIGKEVPITYSNEKLLQNGNVVPPDTTYRVIVRHSIWHMIFLFLIQPELSQKIISTCQIFLASLNYLVR